MEGNQLTFFVTYQDREDLITLSEYDTVGKLKTEINNCFDVPVAKQDLVGWSKVPSGDDSILQVCANSEQINYLEVREHQSPEISSNCEEELTNHIKKDNLDHEMDAIVRLKEKLPSTASSYLMTMHFQDAGSYICSAHKQGKTLLLYLHNSQDQFSQNFLIYINREEFGTIIKESFLIIGWDLEDDSCHTALIQALEPYANLSIVSHLIRDKIGAAICLLPEKNDLTLFFCLRGNVDYFTVLDYLKNAVGQRKETLNSDNNFTAIELEAVMSLKKKLPSDLPVTFRLVSLDDAINFICTSSYDERKALLLYLHNSEQPFSQMFSQSLRDDKLSQILHGSFLVLGWDVENPDYHSALVDALCRHVNLAIVSDLVTNKVPVAVCILPVDGTISVFSCLRGKMTLAESVKSLKLAEDAFKKEIEREKELDEIEREKSHQNDLGSEELQSIWADMLGNRDYDGFEFNQHKYLKTKIGFGLKGPPQNEKGYDNKTLKHIEKLYNIIKTQSNEVAQFKDHIEISFIYVCLEPLPAEKIKRSKKYPDYNPKTDVNPVPVFVLRKCRGSNNPCRIFIDDTGRVYRNWKEYLTKNKLPECEMVVPMDGRYQVVLGKVLLERHLSPACHLDTKLLQVGDIISTVAGLTSGAVFMAAASSLVTIPAAPIVMVAAGVTGGIAGAWAIGRSAYTIYDRVRHKESMSFANSEARGAYLNIVAGSLGFVGAGANMALTQLAARGANIGLGATYLVNTVGVLNIGASGASVVNSGYEVFDQWYNENQAPSALTILQLSSSVLFFGHAVYNFKGAQTIVDETQARVLKDYQDSLRSNRHRKTFNKIMKDTIRSHGDGTRGRAEVISAIRNIQNKDEVFAALTRNNKAMRKAGVKVSADGGKINLGGIAVDMNEFIGLNKKQTETFLNNLSQDGSFKQSASTNVSNSKTNFSLKAAIQSVLSDINMDTSGANLITLINLTSELLIFCSGDIQTKVVRAVHEAINYIFRNISKNIAEEIDKIIPKNTQFFEFLRLGISFFSQKVDEFEQKYQRYQQTRDETYYDPVFDQVNPLYVKRTVQLFEFVVRNSYSRDMLVRAVRDEIAGFVTAWVTRTIFENEEKKERERLSRVHSAGFRSKRTHCNICGGYYFQH